jgi:hypothetical protein
MYSIFEVFFSSKKLIVLRKAGLNKIFTSFNVNIMAPINHTTAIVMAAKLSKAFFIFF